MVKPDFVITFIDATEASLRLTINEFSKLHGPLFSPPCYVLNMPWRILIMPRATRDEMLRWSKTYLGFYMQCDGENICKITNWSCYAIGELSLLNARPDVEPFRRRIAHTFTSKANNKGLHFFMPWNDVLNPEKGYISSTDSITLELHLITEAPKNIGILYDWRGLLGRICVPKKKWSNAAGSFHKESVLKCEKNASVDEERIEKILNVTTPKKIQRNRRKKNTTQPNFTKVQKNRPTKLMKSKVKSSNGPGKTNNSPVTEPQMTTTKFIVQTVSELSRNSKTFERENSEHSSIDEDQEIFSEKSSNNDNFHLDGPLCHLEDSPFEGRRHLTAKDERILQSVRNLLSIDDDNDDDLFCLENERYEDNNLYIKFVSKLSNIQEDVVAEEGKEETVESRG